MTANVLFEVVRSTALSRANWALVNDSSGSNFGRSHMALPVELLVGVNVATCLADPAAIDSFHPCCVLCKHVLNMKWKLRTMNTPDDSIVFQVTNRRLG